MAMNTGARAPTCAKCYDCIVPDPTACPHTQVDIGSFVGGGSFGDPPGTIGPTIPAPATNEQLRDKLCDRRRADYDPDDPGPATMWCMRQAAIATEGALFPDWLFSGETGRPSDGADPPLEP